MALQNLLGDLALETTLAQRAKEVTQQDLYNQIGLLLDRLEFGLMTDTAKALQVGIRSGTVGQVTLVPTVTTVSTVTNQARIGDMQAQRVVEAQMDAAFITGITNHISIT